MTTLEQAIFSIENEASFNQTVLDVFAYQAKHCLIYQQYIHHLGIHVEAIDHYTKIPFLPIEFFKSQTIITQNCTPEIIFSSSGTTGTRTSQHLVAKKTMYERSFNTCFRQFYGEISDVAVLALLPSYLERSGSSLIYMVDDLIKQSEVEASGYFLYNLAELYDVLCTLKTSGQKTVLFGVTYALLDFIERYEIDFPALVVMETGGMKGKRKEMIREELHEILQKGFGVPQIHSEYGMTELLSQAYSYGQGVFQTPPWMRVLIRDTNDPLSLVGKNRTGAINVIDLANLYSCAFIATQDLGRIRTDGAFEVLGRFDNSDIRGCNLLVQ